MKVHLQGSRVAVSSLNKAQKKEGLMYIPDSNDCTGTIEYLGDDYKGSLIIGQIICYGDHIQNIKIEGKDLKVMDPENVIAILEEESNAKEDKK